MEDQEPLLDNKFSKSIATKFIKYIFLCSLVVAILGSLATIYFNFKDQVASLEIMLDNIEKTQLPAINYALRVLNQSQLDIVLDGVIQLPEVEYVEISQEGQSIIQSGNMEAKELSADSDHYITRNYALTYFDTKGEEVNLGNLELIASLDVIYTSIKKQSVGIAIEQIVQMFVVAVVTLFIFIHLVGKHLVVMAAYASSIRLNKLNRPLQLDRASSGANEGDELSDLSDALNAMRENLKVSFEKLQLSEKQHEKLILSLEDKNEELERFTYTASHDLKGPLVTISGFVGLLKNDLANQDFDKVHKDIERIHGAAEIMQKLLEDLLALSRIGRLQSPKKDLDFNVLVNTVLELLEGPIVAENAFVEVIGVLPNATVEETRFQEVFINLIDNALKYKVQETNPHITIGAKSIVNAKGIEETAFYVKDNGMGIEEQYLEKIFGLFDRLTGDIDGTGVGLSIVRRIIEVHGGRIWAESEGTDQGTTFFFVIPLTGSKWNDD